MVIYIIRKTKQEGEKRMTINNSTLKDQEKGNLKGINLQLFAGTDETDESTDKTEETTETTGDNTQTEETEETTDPKHYTEEEVQEMLQREGDKRVSEAEKKFRAKLEKEKKEAEELAKLSADDRKKKELEIEKNKFEEERQEFKREKLKLQTIQDMNEKKLPIEFSEMVMGANAEETLKNITAFETKWNEALSAAVKDKLKGRDLKTGNSTPDPETDPFLKGLNSI